MTMTPTETTPKPGINQTSMDLAGQTASEAIPFLVEKIAYRSMDDSITTKALLENTEFLLKVVNSQKKPEAAQTGTGFSIIINMPGTGEEIVIGGSSVAPARVPEALEHEATALVEEANVLAYGESTDIFDEAPEFR